MKRRKVKTSKESEKNRKVEEVEIKRKVEKYIHFDFCFLVGCVYFEESVLSLRMHTDLRKKTKRRKVKKLRGKKKVEKSKHRNGEKSKSQKNRKVEQYTF